MSAQERAAGAGTPTDAHQQVGKTVTVAAAAEAAYQPVVPTLKTSPVPGTPASFATDAGTALPLGVTAPANEPVGAATGAPADIYETPGGVPVAPDVAVSTAHDTRDAARTPAVVTPQPAASRSDRPGGSARVRVNDAPIAREVPPTPVDLDAADAANAQLIAAAFDAFANADVAKAPAFENEDISALTPIDPSDPLQEAAQPPSVTEIAVPVYEPAVGTLASQDTSDETVQRVTPAPLTDENISHPATTSASPMSSSGSPAGVSTVFEAKATPAEVTSAPRGGERVAETPVQATSHQTDQASDGAPATFAPAHAYTVNGYYREEGRAVAEPSGILASTLTDFNGETHLEPYGVNGEVLVAPRPIGETATISREVIRKVQSALGQLSEAETTIITLSYIEGLTSQDIAERLGIAPEEAEERILSTKNTLISVLSNGTHHDRPGFSLSGEVNANQDEGKASSRNAKDAAKNGTKVTTDNAPEPATGDQGSGMKGANGRPPRDGERGRSGTGDDDQPYEQGDEPTEGKTQWTDALVLKLLAELYREASSQQTDLTAEAPVEIRILGDNLDEAAAPQKVAEHTFDRLPLDTREEDELIISYLLNPFHIRGAPEEAGIQQAPVEATRQEPTQAVIDTTMGDPRFAELYTHFDQIVRIVARRYRTTYWEDVKDAVQQAFLDLAKNWERIDEDNKPGIGAMIFAAKRRFANIVRYETRPHRTKLREEAAELLFEHAAAPGLSPGEEVERRIHTLQERLGNTPHKGIILARASGLTQDEIGDVLGITHNAVHHRYRRGLKYFERNIVGIPPGATDAERERMMEEYLLRGERGMAPPRELQMPNDIVWNETATVEQQWAGRLIASARKEKAIKQEALGAVLRVHQVRISQAEKGTSPMDLNRLYYAAIVAGIDPEDPRMKKVDELRREKNRFHMICQEGITIDTAIMLLRLSSMSSERTFGKKAHLDDSTVHGYTSKRSEPLAYALNDMLTAAGRDPLSKEGQMYHLINNDSDPLSATEFMQKETFEQVGYLLDVLGLTEAEVGAYLSYDQSSVHLFRTGAMTMSPHILARFLELFGYSEPRESLLFTVMLAKIEGREIALTEDEKRKFLTEPILFKEHIEQVRHHSYWLSKEDEEIRRQIRQQTSIHGVYLFMRKTLKKVSLREIHENGGGSPNAVNAVELGNSDPNDINVVRFMNSLGYEFEHPFTQEALRKNRERRETNN